MTDEPTTAESATDEPTGTVTLDTAALRVLAHPTRLALLNRLREHGPATVGQLAGHFDLDSGAASYHLRRLAAGGLIEEDTARGNRRDRWWRARHRISMHDPADTDLAGAADSRAYVQALAMAHGEALRRAATETVPVMADEWFAVSAFTDHTLRLTPTELDRMKTELLAVVDRYREHAASADTESTGAESTGAAPVTVRVQAYPLLTDGE
ncbi:ArsR/SmtB family transcription factor [Streptomyces sp. NPDC091292]|uniref:ArsR/SmtB family transcription factor n=1 Tax=Streptomyces sp. NPDC091292 TaxID=3365991 RepID=UPI00382CA6AF